MKLAAFFDAITPLLEGREEPRSAARTLFGAVRPSEVARLGIYARFCRVHRFEAVDGVYAHCRRAITRLRGERAWATVVERYFEAYPMRHFELNANGANLSRFLIEEGHALEVPSWMPELADLEWWEWMTRVADDAADDATPDAGPLRLASTVELRPYRWDFIGWLDDEDGAGEPARRDTFVLFWRDRDLDPCRDRATPEELAVMHAVHEGTVSPDALADTLDDLHAAGVILGQR